MAELLLELFSEEIPSRMQIPASEALLNDVQKELEKTDLYYKNLKTFVTPRRLVLSIEGLSLTQEDSVEERRGPRIDAPQKAIDGFLKSVNLTIDQLVEKETPKGNFYFAVIKKEGRPTKDILIEILENTINNLYWAKSMRWGEYKMRWARPLKNILCIFGSEILPIKIGHLVANDNTFGHRFMSPDPFKSYDFDNYKQELRNRFVVLDTNKREQLISDKCVEFAKSKNLSVIEDAKLLTEVAGLVEYPVPLLGKIDEQFMSLPQEALISSIKSHQKYFCLQDEEGKIAPYFVVVSNIDTDDNQVIIDGNQRVLRARLSDTKFFWEQDHLTTLQQRSDDLKQIIFHDSLGSLADKVHRIGVMAKFIAVWIPHANLDLVERAAKLCKADIPTEMVGELPELQGIIGRYYAIDEGENQQVADAIQEHYAPLGPSDNCPTAPVSVAIAIADKIDTLIGLFAAGQKPTGSKDPFALRRCAIGIIRIILENKLSVPLKILFEHSIKQYPKSLLQQDDDKKTILGKPKKSKTKPQDLVDDMLAFFEDRLKILLKGENVRHDLISSVFGDKTEDDLLRVVQRVASISQFLATDDGTNLLYAYKRAANIVGIEERKENRVFKGNCSKSLLQQKEETALFNQLEETRIEIKSALKENRFSDVMSHLATLRLPVDDFFDNVIVNCEDHDIRRNRLRILAKLRNIFNKVADFSMIEG